MNASIAFVATSLVVIMIAEFVIRLIYRPEGYDHKDSLANIASAIIYRFLSEYIWIFVMMAAFEVAYKITPFKLPLDAWWVWIVALLMSDFAYYVYHRSAHEFRAFWTIHHMHHSSQDYNFTTAFRLAWLEESVRWLFWVPLPLIGISPKSAYIAYMIVRFYQFFLHTKYVGKLGPLESILSTPSSHRVHHGSNPQYIDKNYGGILIIWDKIFGTFEPEVEPVIYGVTTPLNSNNIFVMNFSAMIELARDVIKAPLWTTKIGLLLRNPAWIPPESELKSRKMKDSLA